MRAIGISDQLSHLGAPQQNVTLMRPYPKNPIGGHTEEEFAKHHFNILLEWNRGIVEDVFNWINMFYAFATQTIFKLSPPRALNGDVLLQEEREAELEAASDTACVIAMLSIILKLRNSLVKSTQPDRRDDLIDTPVPTAYVNSKEYVAYHWITCMDMKKPPRIPETDSRYKKRYRVNVGDEFVGFQRDYPYLYKLSPDEMRTAIRLMREIDLRDEEIGVRRVNNS